MVSGSNLTEERKPEMEAKTMRPETRVDHPRDRAAVAMALVFYGLLLVLADMVGVRERAGIPTTAVLALGVWRARHWAWWGSLALASVALALLAPLLMALMGGPGLTTLVPTPHLVLVCMEGFALIFLIALLTRLHREGGR